MEYSFFLLPAAVLVGVYMAWNIGANDVANAMGTSVGTGAITLRQAVVIAAIFEFAGAFFVGSNVTNTIRKGILDPAPFLQDPEALVRGMLAALIGAAVWLHIATHFGLPVSTTHSIIGSIIGFGILNAGLGAINYGVLGSVVGSWFLSPVMGGLISFTMFTYIRRTILTAKDPREAIQGKNLYLMALVFVVLTLSIIYKGLKNLKLDLPVWEAIGIALLSGAVLGALGSWIIRKHLIRGVEGLDYAERVFRWLQVVTAAYVAFAHGANDVANAIGPLAVVVAGIRGAVVSLSVPVPLWLLGLGGVGIVVGIATYGKRVIETIGKKITDMTPSSGFSATFGAATTVLLFSKIGMPISTTHTLVGSVIGVGLARGISALNLRMIWTVLKSWVATIPIAAGITILIDLLLRWVF
ncbi:MAG: anion permease [Nitrospinota bacterium]|nr:anion permease [Nitrospinota bacterium]HJM44204.1 inorganic phosphate transporter [Nitrospinota bacterium]